MLSVGVTSGSVCKKKYKVFCLPLYAGLFEAIYDWGAVTHILVITFPKGLGRELGHAGNYRRAHSRQGCKMLNSFIKFHLPKRL